MKWEYKIMHEPLGGEGEFHMNKLGQEGWELVAVTTHTHSSSAIFYFKRRVS